ALVSAVALNSAIWSGTRVVAPAAAGLIIAHFNPAAAFYLAALGFAAMAVIVISSACSRRRPSRCRTRVRPRSSCGRSTRPLMMA
ncbi:MAG: hypothetical protein DSY84_05255, partial [Candidatus Neomarinimicrobiota bacterium]